jgi:hypothetical protein
MGDETARFQADPDDAKRYGLRPHQRGIEVRYETIPGREHCPCGCAQRAIDEILSVGLHREMMDESNCWMGVLGLRVWIQAVHVKGQRKPRLVVTAEPDGCIPEARDG